MQESFFRKLRDEFDRFPNTDFDDSIVLGQVGIYSGKRCTFEWRTDLATLGVSAPAYTGSATPPIVDSAYSSSQGSTSSFSVDATSLGMASFAMPKAQSLATQALAMKSERYDIGKLEIAMQNAVNAGLNWNRDWVIVTQVFPADAFTLLYSRSAGCEVDIKTGVPIQSPVFNIADAKLQLAISRTKGAVWSVLAKTKVTPFFRVHKLKRWQQVNGQTKFSIEAYGRGGDA
jgi:hypothetical protein